MLVRLSPNTDQRTESESVAISASDSDLSTVCWSRKKSVMARGIPSAGREGGRRGRRVKLALFA